MTRLVCRKPIHATEHYIYFSHFKSHHLETQRSVVQTLLLTNQAQVFQIVWVGKCTSFGFHDNESFVRSRVMDISELKQRWRRRRQQREGEKSKRFRFAKQQLCACITLFLYISLPTLHDYNVKVPNFSFRWGREQQTTLFLFSRTLIQSSRIQLQKNLPTFDELNEME